MFILSYSRKYGTKGMRYIVLSLVISCSICYAILAIKGSIIDDSKRVDLSKLKSVHILMRHGIRAPWTTYPLDPNINNTNMWPNGKSQLTDSGIEQAYNVGKFLAERYGDFIKESQKQTYLRSSAAQRCIDTLSIISKVLWPPQLENNKWWQPMIFSLPKPIDSVLYEEPFCHLAEEEEKNNLNSKDVQDFHNDPKNKEFYQFIANNTGLSPSMSAVTKAFDCVRCEKYNGFELPNWCTDQVYQQMGDILTRSLNFTYYSRKSQRLRAGPFFAELKKDMDSVLKPQPDSKPKKVFMYTTHDFKIAATLMALGLPQNSYPEFLATLMFELHHIDGQNVVKIFYLNQTVNLPFNPIRLNQTQCDDIRFGDCTYDGFTHTFDDMLNVDWRRECGIDHSYDPFLSAETNLGQT